MESRNHISATAGMQKLIKVRKPPIVVVDDPDVSVTVKIVHSAVNFSVLPIGQNVGAISRGG